MLRILPLGVCVRFEYGVWEGEGVREHVVEATGDLRMSGEWSGPTTGTVRQLNSPTLEMRLLRGITRWGRLLSRLLSKFPTKTLMKVLCCLRFGIRDQCCIFWCSNGTEKPLFQSKKTHFYSNKLKILINIRIILSLRIAIRTTRTDFCWFHLNFNHYPSTFVRGEKDF